MAEGRGHVGNPLTLIAVFAGLSEAVSAAALPFVEGAGQTPLIWFVILFPSALVLMFFVTLWTTPNRLYGPADFRTDEGFMAAQGGFAVETPPRGAQDDAASRLRAFWRPAGVVDPQNERRLRAWLDRQAFETRSLTVFLSDSDYETARRRAVAELGLDA